MKPNNALQATRETLAPERRRWVLGEPMTKANLALPFLISSILAAFWLLGSSHAETSVPLIVVNSKDVPSIAYDAGFVRFIAPSTATEGKTSVLELTEMPGFETPWHQHGNCDESFYVLEGTLTIKTQDKTHELPAGSFIFIPRGTPHSQGNFKREPVKLLTTFTPGGFDRFFADRAELFKSVKRGTPEFSIEMRKLREKHAYWIQDAAPASSQN